MCSVRYASRGLVGLAITRALTGCSLSTGGADARLDAAVPTHFTEASPAATGSPRSDRARSPTHVRPHVDPLQLAAAREDAQGFFRSYVAYLYGQLPVRRVADLTRGRRGQLESDHAEATPAERAARPRITRLTVATGLATATTVVMAVVRAGGKVSPLTATLQRSGATWRVVAVAG
jgi:hypothetical protein